MRHVFSDSFTRPQFAGHETFPLRLLWLKKVFDAVKDGVPSRTFQEQGAIAQFGVGRNMAVSMRYWALASGFVEENDRIMRPTPKGRLILSDEGYDPFLERAATIWLAHWAIASTPVMTTTAYYAFNSLTTMEFDPSSLIHQLSDLAEEKAWKVTRTTLKRDVDVFLRGYCRRAEAVHEDAAEPLMAELALVREAKVGGWYEFVYGPKPSLPDGIFAYALSEFWEREGGASSLSAERVCYDPGSPGRVFKMDENSVISRMVNMERVTSGGFVWTDTAGLRQIQKVKPVDRDALISAAYPQSAGARQ